MTRKQLRESLAPFSKKSYCIPLAHLTLDAAFWLASLALALLAEPLAAKLLGSALIAISTPHLFIIGYDACHQNGGSHLRVICTRDAIMRDRRSHLRR